MFLSSYCAPDRVSLTFFGYLVCPFSDPVHHQLLSYEDIRVEGTLITTIYIQLYMVIYSYPYSHI